MIQAGFHTVSNETATTRPATALCQVVLYLYSWLALSISTGMIAKTNTIALVRRSPFGTSHDKHNEGRRSRSPSRRRHNQRHEFPRLKRKRSPPSIMATQLPLNAGALSKRDLADYKPMFALYLDIQKHLVLDDLSEAEMKGRWKSFISKWYEPVLYHRN